MKSSYLHLKLLKFERQSNRKIPSIAVFVVCLNVVAKTTVFNQCNGNQVKTVWHIVAIGICDHTPYVLYRKTQKTGNLKTPTKIEEIQQQKIYWQKLNHYYLPFKIWSMITKMARLSVPQGPCSAVLPTVLGRHYAFQKFPFIVPPFIQISWLRRF